MRAIEHIYHRASSLACLAWRYNARPFPCTIHHYRESATWLQSTIKDPTKRERLYNLHLIREEPLENQLSTETTARQQHLHQPDAHVV